MSVDAGGRTTDATVEPPEAPTGEGTRNRLGRWQPQPLRVYAERYGVLGCWAIVILVFGILKTDVFLTTQNLDVILGSQGVLVFLVLGLIPLLTAGEFDLSIAANVSLSSVVLVQLNVVSHTSLTLSILAALGCGLTLGVVNALLIVYFGINSFIATLGTSTVVTGLVYLVDGGNEVGGVSNALVNATQSTGPLGVPWEFYYGLALCIAVWYVMKYSAVGKRLLYVGRGRRVSVLSGIRTGRTLSGVIISTGVIASVAGIIYAGANGGADPSSGSSFLLPAFAAAFLGATTINPGRFNAWGGFIAVYFLTTGITGLTMLGAQSYVQNIFYGVALILAVLVAQFRRRREIRETSSPV